MGVQTRVVVYAQSEPKAVSACRAAFESIAALEDIFSDYRPDSELMRLCAASGGPPVKVSDDLFDILRQSLELSCRSGGAFDVTAGPEIRLWRQARKSREFPSLRGLRTARALTDWRLVRLDEKARTVQLLNPGMLMDLGGIGKGFACDRAIQVLRRQGIRCALVEMGGDIVAGDPPPGATGWNVEVANVSDEDERRQEISNRAISSSGDTEQYVDLDGKRYSHIVDPRTGLGLTDRIAVTVTAPCGALSDALSTALSVLDREKGMELLRRHYPDCRAYIRTAAD